MILRDTPLSTLFLHYNIRAKTTRQKKQRNSDPTYNGFGFQKLPTNLQDVFSATELVRVGLAQHVAAFYWQLAMPAEIITGRAAKALKNTETQAGEGTRHDEVTEEAFRGCEKAEIVNYAGKCLLGTFLGHSFSKPPNKRWGGITAISASQFELARQDACLLLKGQFEHLPRAECSLNQNNSDARQYNLVLSPTGRSYAVSTPRPHRSFVGYLRLLKLFQGVKY